VRREVIRTLVTVTLGRGKSRYPGGAYFSPDSMIIEPTWRNSFDQRNCPRGLATRIARRQRGRPVRLRPFAFTAGMPCGMWIATAEADYI
jgi:hypothetical protein